MEIVVLTYSCSLFSLLSFSLSSSSSLLLCLYTIFPHLVFLKEMETSKAEGKRSMKEAATEEEEEDDDEDVGEENTKRRALTPSGKKVTSTAGSTQPSCQVEDCTADLKDAKLYHRRHKVCDHHSKAAVVLVAGIRQRFCQQCSRFHDLSEFDEVKRSCRRRLAGHNERRRKSSYDSHGEG